MVARRSSITLVYIRDVAFVHQGSPPQTNLVRVNGSRAVLMTILKAGSASTLSVIEGIKSLLPRVEESLPASRSARGRRSVCVRQGRCVRRDPRSRAGGPRSSGVMILIFLGSWRSTIIILIAIPLCHLVRADCAVVARRDDQCHDARRACRARRRLLVDDGTVTIENINYHLEQGKEVERAIMDGAQQIVIPAFVTLLCLCIVFMPMFQLGGVAGYLFRPLAEAVVFALLRVLHPVADAGADALARYLLLLAPQLHGFRPCRGRHTATPRSGPLQPVQADFSAALKSASTGDCANAIARCCC